jgi:hypothetical protein
VCRKRFVVLDGVEGAHFHLLHAVVGEDLRLPGRVHHNVDRVGVVFVALLQPLVEAGPLGYHFNESGNFAVIFVHPRVAALPVLVEAALHVAHLLPHGGFGLFLEAGVDGGVDFQAVGVEVVAVFLAPLVEERIHGRTVVIVGPVLVGLRVVVEAEGQLDQRIPLGGVM